MEYAVGIDLHGTLLEDEEYIKDELVEPLLEALDAVEKRFGLYLAQAMT